LTSITYIVQIWPEIKAANQNASVCEIGATIGRLWREMGGEEKQQYNDDFNQDKVSFVQILFQISTPVFSVNVSCIYVPCITSLARTCHVVYEVSLGCPLESVYL
jgi:HMG (high mobility group) box